MQDELGIAVIGCGRIGVTHLEAVQDLKRDQGRVRLIATVDEVVERAENCAERYGAEHYTKDYREIFAHKNIDAVVLALPNHLHSQVTIDAVQAGKHVLVEKPMARNVEEADQMVIAADKANVKLMVAHSRRYIKALYTAWEMIDEIGNPISVTYLSLMTPGYISPYWKKKELSGHLVYTSIGSHTVDYILWLLKSKKRAVRVYSEGHSNVSETEGFDEASMVIGFDDGTLASTILSMNNQTPRIEKVVVIGTKGSMFMEHAYLPASGPALIGDMYSKLIVNDEVIWDGIQDECNFTLQMKEFLACIREDRPPLADGRDVRHVQPLIDAADLSAERHEVIHL